MAKVFQKGAKKVTTISPFVVGCSVAFVQYESGFSAMPEDSNREWGYFVAIKDESGAISGNIISRNSLMAKDAHAEKGAPVRPQFSGSVTANLARKGLPFLESIEGKWLTITETYDIVRRCTIDGEQTEKDCTTVALELGEGKITKAQLDKLGNDFKTQLDNWGSF